MLCDALYTVRNLVFMMTRFFVKSVMIPSRSMTGNLLFDVRVTRSPILICVPCLSYQHSLKASVMSATTGGALSSLTASLSSSMISRCRRFNASSSFVRLTRLLLLMCLLL